MRGKGTAKSRRGSETRKKSIPVTSRYDETEFAELDEAASRAGVTRASYQRIQSLSEPKTRSTRRAPIERELLAKVLGQLGKIGSNLNQLARAANVGETDRAEIVVAVAELRALVPDVQDALGRKTETGDKGATAPTHKPRRPDYRKLSAPGRVRIADDEPKP